MYESERSPSAEPDALSSTRPGSRPHTTRVAPRFLLALGLLATGLPASAAGQQVRGTLLAAEMEMPLSFGAVELLDVALDVVASTFADALGQFSLIAPGPGRYTLRGSHMNARPLIAGDLQLSAGQVVTVELALQLQPIELDSLMVSVEPEYRFLVRNGFYERARGGLGTFVEPELIDRWNPFRVTDLLRRVPGLRLQPNPNGFQRYSISFPRAGIGAIGSSGGGSRCSPKIVVDDVTMYDFDLDHLAVQDVFAMEIYRNGMQAPPRYGGPTAGCGVIVVWTGQRLTR